MLHNNTLPYGRDSIYIDLPSSPACVFEGILFIFLGVRGAGLVLLVCFEISFIGILLRTSRPPNVPELFVPCKSLSMKGKKVYVIFQLSNSF